jgi:hypothetical protein
MSRPPECAATFFQTWSSILVVHLGLQSVTYRVETPCSHGSTEHPRNFENQATYLALAIIHRTYV